VAGHDVIELHAEPPPLDRGHVPHEAKQGQPGRRDRPLLEVPAGEAGGAAAGAAARRRRAVTGLAWSARFKPSRRLGTASGSLVFQPTLA
jgi:hypothetical protein